MIEFAMHFPETNELKAYLNFQVLPDDSSFLVATAERGYEIPRRNPELKGLSFNTRCTITGSKATWIVLNASRICIETIHHEIRHAIFWYLSDVRGVFAVDVLNSASEEGVNRAIDLSVRRAVHTIVEATGAVIPYFEFEDMPEIEQLAVMGID